MPETLAPANRRSLAAGQVLDAFRQTVTNRQTLGYALVAGGVLGSLFAYIFIAQQVFTGIYQLGHYFPLAFAGVAVGTAIAGFVNSRLVGRLGMRVISHAALIGYIVIAAILLAAAKLQMVPLPLFMVLSVLLMFAFGLMISNFTALAMEPQGHIAGTAASLYGSITTLLAIGIGATIGQDFDGTLVPFATGFLLCTLASLAVVLVVEKGRLFQPHGLKV
jgi:MFS transporter, DHA1 family, multidrug resistance protein